MGAIIVTCCPSDVAAAARSEAMMAVVSTGKNEAIRASMAEYPVVGEADDDDEEAENPVVGVSVSACNITPFDSAPPCR